MSHVPENRWRIGHGRDVEIVEADLQSQDQTLMALAGANRAFYLVHSMTAERNFAEARRKYGWCFR
ncbi:MAG: hypothetical protein CM15mP49_26090 [Actinomycetota bacterium]|nr:MAG: hypothetical protein CM15mP49_26090 [Actinomycetota bacterium]